MLHTGSFNERFDYSDIDDDEEEEVDNYIKGPDVLNPKICPRCKKYILEIRKYHRKDAKNNVLYCENCGYLCIRCGELIAIPPKRSGKAVIECINKHRLYS